jgi:hypothetical protein
MVKEVVDAYFFLARDLCVNIHVWMLSGTLRYGAQDQSDISLYVDKEIPCQNHRLDCCDNMNLGWSTRMRELTM